MRHLWWLIPFVAALAAFRRGDDYLVNKVWILLAFQLWRSEVA